jgi:hypothetical protein
MIIKISKVQILIFSLFLLLFSINSSAQIREYRIHDRGMLHETVYNTGEIGRGWMTGESGNVTNLPLFEWPSRSRNIVDGIEYSGQHNILGAGIYIAANIKGSPGIDNRIYALCGGVGASDPEVSFGKWSFPYYIEEIENFPVLENGELNPDYDPNEAEEIIRTSWASSVGIAVTRTSRVWSYPDYDDMIIYEYEFEYNGDTDGNPATIEIDAELTDVMILFIYGFAPSMYGYQRTYGEWKYDAGIYRGDQNNFWDADYWLSFNLNLRTNLDADIFAKPEPNKDLFREFSETGLNGGGLTSPQAPGFCMLYYDLNHLAIVDPVDPNRNESEVVNILRTSNNEFYEIDENDHIKQPYSNKVSTGNTRSSKMMVESINPTKRWSGVYSESSTTWPMVPHNDPRWYGRAAYPYRQSADAGQKHIVFGPYTLVPGDKLNYALAEVCGYGGEPFKRIEGGQTQVQWAPTPSWDGRVIVSEEVMTENYLTDYGYPDYVNSDVKNVSQVAHNAFTAYLGQEPVIPQWPEDNSFPGVYNIPVPPPAPAINVTNTDDGNVRINWIRTVENFTHPRLTGQIDRYLVLKSIAGMGPWNDTVAVVNVGEVGENNQYTIIDDDESFVEGDNRYYSVITVDEHGNVSGKTNLIKFKKNIGAVEKMNKVYAVPNPFYINSGFSDRNFADKIGFYGLPEKCTIRIFSYAGNLVETIEHDEPVFSTANEWLQVTRNGQEIASGVYFFVVTTPEGEQTQGKFIVIK